MKTLRGFWALPAFLRLSLAFSVQEDLLAHPQYEIIFPDSVVPESYASSRLALADSPACASSSSATSRETQELSRNYKGSSDHPDEYDEDAPSMYEVMSLGNQRYLCRIPIVDAAQNHTTSPQSRDEEEKELMRATDRGWELLQGMQGDCIYYLSGWWSYSFCYNNEVKQFHQLPPGRGVPPYPPVEDTSVHSFVLGRFPKKDQAKGGEGDEERAVEADDDGEEAKSSWGSMELAKLETKGETRYLVQKLGGGTTCDLTGRERKIEVQFHCNPSAGDRIGMIKEVSTCSYMMVIYTPRLCNDVAFLPPQEIKPNTITCRAIFPDNVDLSLVHQHPFARFQHPEPGSGAASEEQKKGKDDDVTILSNTSPASLPNIGGVIVGAKSLVGTPGKVIEKSVVVGGDGKETFLGTVANSAGKMMSEREMRRLSIRNVQDIEKLQREIKKLAGGKNWRLDLVETARGREFRGIIETDDNAEIEMEGKSSEDEREGSKDGEGRIRKGKSSTGGGGGTGEKGEEGEEGSEEVYKEDL